MVCKKLTKSILRQCGERPVMGIEQNLILINFDDVRGFQKDEQFPNSLINGIDLGDGFEYNTNNTSKYAIQINGIKQIMNYSNSLQISEDSENGLTHSIAGIRIYDPSAEVREEISKFVSGNRVFAILERKWKGQNKKDAFLLFGLTFGLELSELTDSSNENDGTIVMSLSTPGGFKEPNLPHVFRDTDYSTTQTVLKNLLIASNGCNGGGVGTSNI